jgi:hypothetical protein
MSAHPSFHSQLCDAKRPEHPHDENPGPATFLATIRAYIAPINVLGHLSRAERLALCRDGAAVDEVSGGEE